MNNKCENICFSRFAATFIPLGTMQNDVVNNMLVIHFYYRLKNIQYTHNCLGTRKEVPETYPEYLKSSLKDSGVNISTLFVGRGPGMISQNRRFWEKLHVFAAKFHKRKMSSF